MARLAGGGACGGAVLHLPGRTVTQLAGASLAASLATALEVSALRPETLDAGG